MTTDKVTIDRELLEQVASEFEHDNDRYMLGRELRKILDAPRQPEGDGLEVVAVVMTEEQMGIGYDRRMGPVLWIGTPPAGEHLMTVSQHQRAIAELREECKIHRNSAAGAHNQLRANRLETERLAVDWQAAVAERDTLRQQLAERDAEIERLRVKLMTIASAEPGRHNIEWAKAMAATGNNAAYAKWRAAFDQRDKLAGLLYEASGELRTDRHHGLGPRIDAALTEVEPCQESPAPTT